MRKDYKKIFNKVVLLPVIGLSIAVNSSAFASDDTNKSLNLSIPIIADPCNEYIVNFGKSCAKLNLDLGRTNPDKIDIQIEPSEQEFKELSSLEMSKTVADIAVDKTISRFKLDEFDFLNKYNISQNLFSKIVYKLAKSQAQDLIERVHSKYTGEEPAQNEEENQIGFSVDFKF